MFSAWGCCLVQTNKGFFPWSGAICFLKVLMERAALGEVEVESASLLCLTHYLGQVCPKRPLGILQLGKPRPRRGSLAQGLSAQYLNHRVHSSL